MHTPALEPTLLELTAEESEAIRVVAEQVTADPITDPDGFGRQALAASFDVPESVRRRILNFGDVGSDTGILVVRGLHVDEGLVDTPLDNTHAIAARTHFAKEMGVLAQLLGSMVAYEAEGHGNLIQDMVPNPKLATAQQSQGSKVELEAHTEQCFSDNRPDYVLLGALRGDEHAATFAYCARKFKVHFTPEEIAKLRQPLWATMIDESFRPFLQDPEAVRGPYPILTGPDDDPYILIDQDLMHGVTAPAQQLLEKVVRVYIDNRDAHVLEAGDLLLLDNLRAMHGRSQFSPRFDGKDRFIARGFVVRDRRRMWPMLKEDRRTLAASHS